MTKKENSVDAKYSINNEAIADLNNKIVFINQNNVITTQAISINTNKFENPNFIQKIYINENGLSEKFTDVKYTLSGNKVIDVQEYYIAPQLSVTDTFVQANNVTQVALNNKQNSEIVWESGSLVYEDVRGIDFLESYEEEKIDYYISKSEDGGDVYKLLKSSLSNEDDIEIWGYSFLNDKIDLTDFAQDFKGTFSYSVEQSDSNINLHIHADSKSYNLVFKEYTLSREMESLDNIFHNIIITNTADKA